MPPMFWVMLAETVPQGTHEFAIQAATVLGAAR